MTADATLGPKGIEIASYGGLTSSDLKVLKKGCAPTLAIQLQRAANRLNWALALSANTLPWSERYTEFLRNERFVVKEARYVDQNGRLWTKYEVMTPQEKNLFDSLDHFAQIMELADAERCLHSGVGGGRPPVAGASSESIAAWLKNRGYSDSQYKKALQFDAMAHFGVGKTKVTDAIRMHGLARPRVRKGNDTSA